MKKPRILGSKNRSGIVDSRTNAFESAAVFPYSSSCSMVNCGAEDPDPVRLAPRLASVFLLLFIFFNLAGSSAAQTTSDCLRCHGQQSLTVTRHGRAQSLYVDNNAFNKSVHASFMCVDCHIGLEPFKIPHAKVIRPVQCQCTTGSTPKKLGNVNFDTALLGFALG